MTTKSEMVYRVPGKHRGPNGCTYDFMGVDSVKDAPKGWYPSLEEAMSPPKTRKRKAKVEADGTDQA